MALVIASRVLETTATLGAGPFALNGPRLSYRSFASVCSDGDTCPYCAVDRVSGAWESGVGTYVAATNTLARTEVDESSSNNDLVMFAGNPLTEVYIDLTASMLTTLLQNASGSTPASGLQDSAGNPLDDSAGNILAGS